MVNTEDKNKKHKLQSVLQIVLILATIIAVNVFSEYVYSRIDLTDDKRYTLGEPTRNMLEELDDIVYITVYLEAQNLPPGFRRLRRATREMIEEFKSIAGDKIQFRFVDPSAIEDRESRENLYEQLTGKGLSPINLQVQRDDGASQQIVFPGALIRYKTAEVPVSLLQSQLGTPPNVVLHNSILSLEYEFVNAMRKMQTVVKKRIAFVDGHGQLPVQNLAYIKSSLSDFYEVERLNLPEEPVHKLLEFDAAIIAKPTKRFSELEKYKIDQFIMNGGRVLWLVETLIAEMDSLDDRGIAFTSDYDLNLSDQLFNYGVRINNNLVQDINSHQIPLMLDQLRGQPTRSMRPWPFYPVVFPVSNHPIVNNLNAILFRFANTIDTLRSPDIDKTVLLQTSPYSRVLPHPVRINLQMTQNLPDESLFRAGPQPLAVLLEGEFTSLYKNRIAPATLDRLQAAEQREPKDKGYSQMIVISDGNLIKNDVHPQSGQVFPLGYDRFTNQTFGNENFLLNCIDYLIDDSDILTLRTKDFRMRLLDEARIRRDKTYWQSMNMIVPLLSVIIFGIAYNYIRKRRYTE